MTIPPTCYFTSMRSRAAGATEHDTRRETPVLPPHSLAVAAVSTVVEWYDFTLYLYFATVLARVFFRGGRGSLLVPSAALRSLT